jgi:xanthine dehydrogenase accessory factor
MKDLLATYDAWRAEGLEVGRAVVVRTFGSAPRAEGSVLMVASDGRMVGSVSGGCVEGAAAEEVQRAIESRLSRVIRYGISDEQAWAVLLTCGGTIDVLIEPHVSDAVIAGARRSGVAVVTPLPDSLPPPDVGPYRADAGDPQEEPFVLPTDPGDLSATIRAAAKAALDAGRSQLLVDAGRGYFVEAFPARPRLVVIGATEVARSLVGLAHNLGYETVVADARSAFATAERFPDVDRLLVMWPDEAFDAIGLIPSDAVAVLSHDPKFDEPAIIEGIRRGARYVGALGSRKSQIVLRERLRNAGLGPADLSRLHGPIGLDLGGREPVEMALAVIAEIVAERRGGSGVPLRDRDRPAAIAGGAFEPSRDQGSPL